MISRRVQENTILVIIILVLIGIIVMSFDYGPRARMVPIPVAAFGLVLAVIQLVWQNMRSADELQIDLLEVLTKRKNAQIPDKVKPAVPTSNEDAGVRWKREVTAYGMVLLFLAMAWAIGPMPSIFLFTLGYFAVSRQYSWLRGFFYTVIFTVVVYVVFVYTLEIQLYHGYLEPVAEFFR